MKKTIFIYLLFYVFTSLCMEDKIINVDIENNKKETDYALIMTTAINITVPIVAIFIMIHMNQNTINKVERAVASINTELKTWSSIDAESNGTDSPKRNSWHDKLDKLDSIEKKVDSFKTDMESAVTSAITKSRAPIITEYQVPHKQQHPPILVTKVTPGNNNNGNK